MTDTFKLIDVQLITVLRIVLCAAVACSAQGSSGNVIKLQNGGFLTYAIRGKKTLLAFKGVNKPLRQLALKRDKDVAPQSSIKRMKVVGEIGRNVLILTDTYYSVGGSMHFCQAGDETFLRVVALRPEPKITFERKLESCRSNLELAEPGLVWTAQTFTLEIRWLQNPDAQGKPYSQIFKLDSKGRVAPLPSE